jgi:hypothetical protein
MKVACHDIGKLPDHRTDVKIPHTKSHLLLKVRDRLLLKDYFSAKSQAKWRSTWAQNIYQPPSKAEIEKSSEEAPMAPEGDEREMKEADTTTNQIVTPPHTADCSKLPENNATLKSDTDGVSTPSTAPADDEGSGLIVPSIQDSQDILRCLYCHTRVTTPCWYCSDCTCESVALFAFIGYLCLEYTSSGCLRLRQM